MDEDKNDWEELVELPECERIFRIRYHRLSLRAIGNLRSRLTGEVWHLRGEITKHYYENAKLTKKVNEKEEMLKDLSEKVISQWIKIKKTERGGPQGPIGPSIYLRVRSNTARWIRR